MPRSIAIITREQARRRRLKLFFTGRPCQHGHVCERYVKRSWCVECARAGLRPEGRPPAEKLLLHGAVQARPCRRPLRQGRRLRGLVQESYREWTARQKAGRERSRESLQKARDACPGFPARRQRVATQHDFAHGLFAPIGTVTTQGFSGPPGATAVRKGQWRHKAGAETETEATFQRQGDRLAGALGPHVPRCVTKGTLTREVQNEKKRKREVFLIYL